IKPLGYRLRNGSKLLYRKPAFLICTDLKLDLQTLRCRSTATAAAARTAVGWCMAPANRSADPLWSYEDVAPGAAAAVAKATNPDCARSTKTNNTRGLSVRR